MGIYVETDYCDPEWCGACGGIITEKDCWECMKTYVDWWDFQVSKEKGEQNSGQDNLYY